MMDATVEDFKYHPVRNKFKSKFKTRTKFKKIKLLFQFLI